MCQHCSVEELGGHLCPVCGYDGLPTPAWRGSSPSDDLICPACGVQYGYHDSRADEAARAARHAELRERWIADGCRWHFKDPPAGWDPEEQLERLRGGTAGVAFELLDFEGTIDVLAKLTGRLVSVAVIGEHPDTAHPVQLAQLAGRLRHIFPQGGSTAGTYFALDDDSASGFNVVESLFAEARLKDWRGMTNGRSVEIQLGAGMIRVFAPEREMRVGAAGHPEIG